MRDRPANRSDDDGSAEVVAAARPVLDLGGRAGDRGLDPLLISSAVGILQQRIGTRETRYPL